MGNKRNSLSSKRHYIRLFNVAENAKKAIFMLNSGYTFNSIALVLGCDHTSVMAFRKRMITKGVKFNVFKRTQFKKVVATDIFDGKQFKKVEIDSILNQKTLKKVIKYRKNIESVSGGKDYKDYLEEDEKKNRPIRLKRMKEARETIEKVRRYRKEHGIIHTENTFHF